MKILMTGATGFVGRALALQLQGEGHHLVALARDPATARSLLGSETDVVSMAGLDGKASEVLLGVDAVINLAGEPVVGKRWSSTYKKALRSSRVGLTNHLVRWMADQPTPPHTFISASAIGYYGEQVAAQVDERTGSGSSFLARLCAEWERAAYRAEKFGTRVVTLRTGVVLGKGGGALAKLEPIFRLGLGGRLGDGQQFVSWIHLHDIVNAISLALKARTLRGPLNIVSPTPLTNRSFTTALANAVGRPAVLPVPKAALRLLMGEASTTVLGGQRVVPEKLRSVGFNFQFPTIESALDDLLNQDMGCTIGKVGPPPESDYLVSRPPRYELHQQTTINAPIEQVMRFFSNAENLAVLTPPNVDFSITSPTPIVMKEGASIAYTIRVGRIPLRWKTEIEAWEPQQRFVDIQRKGPYRCWWHQHSFRSLGQQTIMEDRVLYSLPFGVLGRLVHKLKVSRMLTEIFTFRTRAIMLRFGSPGSRDSPFRESANTVAPSKTVAYGA